MRKGEFDYGRGSLWDKGLMSRKLLEFICNVY
jgi:hypothetical protein